MAVKRLAFDTQGNQLTAASIISGNLQVGGSGILCTCVAASVSATCVSI
jgi:hypothetical protein|tara:strand:+ start:1504 stop:1650 length:147 start_codon:yes stop_codon:yes gene_type:complete